MTNQLQGKYTRGFGLSLVIIMIINGLLVIIKESSTGLMNAMKGTLAHHWTTHGVLLTMARTLPTSPTGLPHKARAPTELPITATTTETGMQMATATGPIPLQPLRQPGTGR